MLFYFIKIVVGLINNMAPKFSHSKIYYTLTIEFWKNILWTYENSKNTIYTIQYVLDWRFVVYVLNICKRRYRVSAFNWEEFCKFILIYNLLLLYCSLNTMAN